MVHLNYICFIKYCLKSHLTREVAAVPAVTGLSTSTTTASATTTKGGSVVTDYRYARYGTDAQTEDLTDGEYYTDSGSDDADGNDIVYVQVVVDAPDTEIEITPAQPATEETYNPIVETVTTLPDTITEERTTVTTATRTKAGS